MSDTPQPIHQILSGNADALPAMDRVIAQASSRLAIFDHTLEERGYNAPARHASLRAFCLASRSNVIRIALHRTEGLEGYCPRLMMLLSQFPMQIKIHRALGQALQAQDGLLIADDAHYWHKLHFQHPRSVLSLHSPNAARPLADRFEEIWESSEPGVASSVTGL